MLILAYDNETTYISLICYINSKIIIL